MEFNSGFKGLSFLYPPFFTSRFTLKISFSLQSSRKVAGSISDGTIGPGVDSALTEMSTRNISWGGGGGKKVHTADNLTTSMCRLSGSLGASTSWNPQSLSTTLQGLLYLYLQWGKR